MHTVWLAALTGETKSIKLTSHSECGMSMKTAVDVMWKPVADGSSLVIIVLSDENMLICF